MSSETEENPVEEVTSEVEHLENDEEYHKIRKEFVEARNEAIKKNEYASLVKRVNRLEIALKCLLFIAFAFILRWLKPRISQSDRGFIAWLLGSLYVIFIFSKSKTKLCLA